jgi:putative lipoprotein
MSWACKIALIALLILAAFSAALAEEKKADRWFSSDKYRHFAVSAFYSAGISIVADKHFDVEKDRALAIGFGVTFALGGAKEIKDYHTKGETASFKDLAWDIAGALTGILAAGFIL